MFATYVHDLDPVLLPIHGSLALRWYGLAYLLGFVAGFLLLRSLARRGIGVLRPEQTGDFIAAAAMFGVFLGGRLGYLFFYQLPKSGWHVLLDDPLMVLRVWEGGMASHGGLLGLGLFTAWYAHRHQISWPMLADNLCVVGPLGLFFGRIANFINGELYGRITDVPWAVKFPLSIAEEPPEVQAMAWQAVAEIDPKLADAPLEKIIAAARQQPEISATFAEYLQPRHPSQLYEGLLEGLLIFIILWVLRLRFPKAPAGMLAGLFFLLYATFRIFCETMREPDAAMIGGLTKGQFFSLFLYLAAAGFFACAWRKMKSTRNS
ncbi:MAG: prolipoprotein diacylglyceryl transferase [Verrucomicrobia bacterium]|nr:MAG: prolipoprotein diacylglyceryl transferase [Verrucomicrobiota bacterium]